MRPAPPITVEPRLPGGGRPVRAEGQQVGIARSPEELLALLHDLGYAHSETDLDDSADIEWRGGGIENW